MPRSRLHLFLYGLLYPGVLGSLFVFWIQLYSTQGFDASFNTPKSVFGAFAIAYFMALYTETCSRDKIRPQTVLFDFAEVFLILRVYYVLGFFTAPLDGELGDGAEERYFFWMAIAVLLPVFWRMAVGYKNWYLNGMCIGLTILYWVCYAAEMEWAKEYSKVLEWLEVIALYVPFIALLCYLSYLKDRGQNGSVQAAVEKK